MKLLKALLLVLMLPTFALAQNAISTASKTISVTPTIDTAIYASGDALGGLQTLSNAARGQLFSGIVHSVVVTDLASQGADIDIVIFSSNPSNTTVTNNAPLDIADADLSKVICVIPVSSDEAFVDNGVSYAHGTNCVFQLSQTVDLYAIAVVRGTPTYATASDLTFRYSILQD